MPDPDARPRLRAAIAPAGIVVGILMIAASFFVPQRTISRANWSNAQASDYQQASLRLHELSHEAAEAADKGAPEKVAEELTAARARVAALQAELEAATQSPLRLATVLRWGGMFVAATGIAVYLVFGGK